jgi:membrane metallo-endopeptidase-like protein 1
MTYNETKSEDKIQALKDFLGSIMGVVSSDANKASTASIASSINDVVGLDKKFADVISPHWPAPSDPEDYEVKAKKIKFSELKRLFSTINWDAYLKNNARISSEIHAYLSGDPEIFVYTPELFSQLNEVIKNTDKKTLANYLITRYTVSNVPYLDSRFTASANQFAQKLDGSPHVSNRDQDCLVRGILK